MEIKGYVIREEKEKYIFKNGGMLVVFSPLLVYELAKADPVDMQAFELFTLSPGDEKEPDTLAALADKEFNRFCGFIRDNFGQEYVDKIGGEGWVNVVIELLKKKAAKEPDYKKMWEEWEPWFKQRMKKAKTDPYALKWEHMILEGLELKMSEIIEKHSPKPEGKDEEVRQG